MWGVGEKGGGVCMRTACMHVRVHAFIVLHVQEQLGHSKYVLPKLVNQIMTHYPISPYPVPAKGCVNFENSWVV